MGYALKNRLWHLLPCAEILMCHPVARFFGKVMVNTGEDLN